MHRLGVSKWLWAASVLAVVSPLSAQWTAAVPTAKKPPVLDGTLSPGEWDGAAHFDNFKQIEPKEGAAPSDKTVVYLMCDKDNLYIGVMCHDSEPKAIRANIMARDAVIDPDDHVELVIDTFLDKRNAYFFQIGPGGSLGDGLVGNNGAFFSKEWDGIWDGRARIVKDGWSAEMAIPAKTLGMSSTHDVFGFNIVRFIKHRDEIDQWANPDRNTDIMNVDRAGTISGMRVLDKGIGIDFKPYALARWRHGAPRDNGLSGDGGFDLRWRLANEVTAVLTANTDFAETEIDDRIVSLSRFPVFFREKRGFFLEDSSIFAFGGLSSDTVPFFSRRIGLSSDGSKVPILGGVKATGRIGDLNFGILDVVTDSFAGVETKNLAVGRLALNILEESQVGAIFTKGDPATNGDNGLLGLDFTYRTHKALGDQNFRVDAFAMGTEDSPDPTVGSRAMGYAYGVKASYPNDTLEALLGYREISDDFRPDLGFVSRVGERELFGQLEYRPRIGGGIKRFAFGVQPDAFVSLDDGQMNTLQVELKLFEIEMESEDRVAFLLTPTSERLIEPFEIEQGVTLPPGRYGFERFGIEFETADKRVLSAQGKVETGSFFDGKLDTYSLDLTIRPIPGLSFGPGIERNVARLDEGSFTTNLARLRVKIDFSPTVSWNIFAQYDDVSNTIGVNSRFRWIINPGNELFFVVNQGFETRDPVTNHFMLRSPASEITAKIGYTFRF